MVEWIEVSDINNLPNENECVLVRYGFEDDLYTVAFMELSEFDSNQYPEWHDSFSFEIIGGFSKVTHWARFERPK